MLFTELKIGDKELKLRLDAKGCVSLERKLGKNPLNVFMTEDKSMPKLEDLLSIFHASLQKYQNGYKEETVYELYDEYVEEGNAFTDFVPVIMEIYKASGFFSEADMKKAEDEAERKKRQAITKSL